ncbi:DMT family transporter [Microbacterium sp. NIBRBAC000506063]|uniref:DMT family transporter n=1 Tax=Microbacterium sp. NIBRBAC000506063 TaxID=2734618 RepID=UPI00397EFF43
MRRARFHDPRVVTGSAGHPIRPHGAHLGVEFPVHEGRPRGVSSGQVAWSRLVLGAMTLAVFVLVRRDVLPRSVRVWAHMTVLALSFCVVPFLLFSWAQQYVTSGLASIYNATTPIMTAVMAWAVFRVEKLRGMQIVGILLGMLGSWSSSPRGRASI